MLVRNKELADQIAFLQNSVGAIAGAFDSFLVLRSLKTLALRMERHCSNALEIARWLEDQREVKSVHYPGIKIAFTTRFGPATDARVWRDGHHRFEN